MTPSIPAWNSTIYGLPGAHILQTWEWAEFKHSFGWKSHPQVWLKGQGRIQQYNWNTEFSVKGEIVAAAMLLKRSLSYRGIDSGINILYVPRGPLLDWNEPVVCQQVLRDLIKTARRLKAIFIKIDPEISTEELLKDPGIGFAEPENIKITDYLSQLGWRRSEEQVQFRNTILLDLTAPEEELLSRMKQKTRYNIRLAAKKGVIVRTGVVDDFPNLYRMYAETSIRDSFVIRDESYYQRLWESFYIAGMLVPLVAEVAGEIVAGVIVFKFAERAWYLYGMSRGIHREKMPNYLLQWEAISRAKASGCKIYDLWGAPELENASDPLWGVFRFKEGLGGRLVNTSGAWDYPVSLVGYNLYTRLIPLILNRMRKTGMQNTLESMG